MKILHVISGIPPRAGGPSGVVRALAVAQAEIGHGVTICTTNVDSPAGVLDVPVTEPVVQDGVLIWYHSLGFRPLYFSRSLGLWLYRHLGEFDVVHVHGLYRFPPTFAAALARRRRIPYLIRPHGSLDPFMYRQSRASLPLKRLYERAFDLPNLNGAAAIHYTSEDEAVRTRFLRLRAPAVVVPNGLRWDEFEQLPAPGAFRARLGLQPAQPLILFLGRLNFKKGLDLLIPAFASVTQWLPSAHLAVVGPDNEGLGRQVRQWCQEYGVQAQVSFVDHVSAPEAREAYVDATVFVLPSYTENFGMTVAEAMACRCPVVVTKEVNISPFVSEARAGLVVGVDAGEIGDALVRILSDPAMASAMGSAGRALVQERFEWGRIVSQLDRVYESALRR